MGLEFVRGNNSRCPSFIVAGLMVMCLFLVCSWWSLSSQNFELLRQIQDLAEQLKVNGEELGRCIDQKFSLKEKIKGYENGVAQQQIRINQIKASEEEMRQKIQKQEDQLNDAVKKSESTDNELGMCKTELESVKKLGESKDKTLETLRTEKSALLTDIDQRDTKIKELEENVNSLKKKIDKFNTPIAKALSEKSKGVADEKAEKETLGDGESEPGGVVFGGNHDAADQLDKNSAAAVKTDVEPQVPEANENIQPDPREALMKGGAA